MDEKLKEILDCFSLQLQEILESSLVGIYLTGSIALNGYHAGKSDIDFAVVLDEALSKEQMPGIEALHRNLAGRFPKTIMEGQYVTVKDLGKLPGEIPPVITCYNGKIGSSYEGINAVTWFTLKRHGVTLWGKPASQLDFDFPEKKLLQYVQENVNTYWKRWLSDSGRLFSLRGIYGFTKPSVEWGVLGISRMYYTLRERDVVSKEDAGKYALEHVPERFRGILNTAVAIRTNCLVKQGMSWIKRRKRMLEVIEYLITECNQVTISGR